MGVAQVPAASSSAVKTVQRGSAAGAGTVTITAVDINKSFVNVFGSASSGTVATSFTLNANSTSISSMYASPTGTGSANNSQFFLHSSMTGASANAAGNSANNAAGTWTPTVNAANYSVSGGSNNLVSAVVTGYLSGSTSLVVSGACRWEVVEFN